LDWYELTDKYHEKTFAHDGDLESLPEVWQRELAAVWRMEADINNGGYLQFIANWGVSTHRYGLAALQKMGADTMAKIVAESYSTLNSAVEIDKLSRDQLHALMPNPVIDRKGNTIKEAGSTLSPRVLADVNALSFRFMDYPDDLPELGLKYYGPFVTN
jgi:hypothetical protein